MLGKTIAHYEITAKLGEGGMGVVWCARDTKLGREVALKFLPEAFVGDPARHARFHTEAQALASFTHPHVGGVHALEEADGRHFLVMELIEGMDLADRLRQGPLPSTTALNIARQLALALEAAHVKNIIHRDLKPANIKINDRNQVKILDFGLAKFQCNPGMGDSSGDGFMPTVTSELTLAGAIMGTAAYMSPEQARGQDIDKRADIWALGCVLYEMLTGKLAFAGETASDTLAAVLRAEPDWSALPDDTHPATRRLLQRCLQKDAQQRWHDVADVRIELDDILNEEDLPLPSEAPTTGGRKWRPLTLGLAVACLALAAVAGWSWLSGPPDADPVVVRTLTFSGRDWAPNASPDGRTVAFVSDRDGVSRIWLKQLATGTEAPLTSGPDNRPRFSPDGSQILFVRGDGQVLYRIPVLGGTERKMMDNVLEADWSPDGSEVVFMRSMTEGDNSVVRIAIADAQSGEERLLAAIENRFCFSLCWSLDGQHISVNEIDLTGNSAGTTQIELIDPVTGQRTPLKIKNWTGGISGLDWANQGGSLIVGQSKDMLDYVSGAPSLLMQYDLASGRTHDLFWGQLRMAGGGWAYTSPTALNDHQLVFDSSLQYAELKLVPLRDGLMAGPAVTLTTSLGHDRQPVFSPDGQQVLFSSNRSGNIDLWLVDITTGHVRQLTDDAAHDWDPAFSPDGRFILWSSNRSGNMEIWIANADGSGARQVSRDGQDAENPTMTRDGQWVVYGSSHETQGGIWKVHPDGSGAEMIVPGALMLPEVSPDGRLLLYSSNITGLKFKIFVVDLATGDPVDFKLKVPAVDRNVDVVIGRARWSVDGRSIVFVGQDKAGQVGIYRQPFVPGKDTSADKVLISPESREYQSESLGLSPDGRTLVISAMYNRRQLMLAENFKLRNWE